MDTLLPTYETPEDILASVDAGAMTAVNLDVDGIDGVRLVLAKYPVGSPARERLVLLDMTPVAMPAVLCILKNEHYNHGIDDECRCLACGEAGGAD